MSHYVIAEDYSVLYFDVKSLFTPIPHDLAKISTRSAITGNDERWTDVECVMKLFDSCISV